MFTLSKTLCGLLLAGPLVAMAGPAALSAEGPIDEVESALTVLSFGAAGDGQTDDTAAIQRAVDAGIGQVRFPKGVYLIQSPIVVRLDQVGYTSIEGNGVSRIVMAGSGPAFRLVGTHSRSADPEGFAANVWDRQRMPLIDGVAIVGQRPDSDGIEASGTMELTITRTHIRNVRHGIHLVGNNRNIILSDCHVYDCRGVGIYYDNVNLHQSNITGCHISYNGGGGVVSRGGNVRNIQITGCDLESNMTPTGEPTANVLIDCRGSQYGTGEVAITGCTIQHNNPSPDSANIRMIGASQPSGKLTQVREGNLTVTGNVLSDVQVNIHLTQCRGVIITGNTFWQGYTHNLLVEDSSNVIVGPNNFDRNPRYNYGNTQEANNSLVFRNCQDCTLSGLHITNVWRDPAALRLDHCRRMNVTNCTILDCDHVGLWLKDVSDSRVSGCLIRDDRPGAESTPLQTTGGHGNLIVDNLLGP